MELEKLTENQYNCIDTIATSVDYEGMLADDRNRRSFLFDQAILGPAMTMQLRGVKIDKNAVRVAEEETEDAAKDLQTEFNSLATRKVKWGKGIKASPKQLMEILYGDLKVRVRTSKEGAPTVNKEAIAAIIDDPKTPEQAYRLAEIFQELSVLEEDRKVLRKPLREDGRMHTTFVPAGATTGRFCLPPETEVLTRQGWVSLESWDEKDEIAVWYPNSNIYFERSKKVEFSNSETLISVRSTRGGNRYCKYDLLCTKEHRLPYYDLSGDLKVRLAGDKKILYSVPLSGNFSGNFEPELHTRACVMLQADGHVEEGNYIKFHFKKDRKIFRCISILGRLGVPYTTYKDNAGATTIRVSWKNVPSWLRNKKVFGSWLFDHNPQVFIDELQYWDGTKIDANNLSVATSNKIDYLWIQILAHLSGHSTCINVHNFENPNHRTSYRISISTNNTVGIRNSFYKETKVAPNKVFCAITSSGFFLVRNGLAVFVTGNSAKMDHFSTGCNLQALSHRLHKIFVPDDGYVFVNMDQKQAESKGVAYLAGCQKYKEFHKSGNTHVSVGKVLFPELNYTKEEANNTKLPWDQNHSYYDLFKRVQHSTNYFISPYGMARQIHCKVKDAEDMQNKYFGEFPEIREWQREIAQKLKIYHSLTTPLGRSRLFLGRTWDDSAVKEAIAYIPQSMISQLNKIILWRIWNHFDPKRAQVLLEGHDSNLFQIREGDSEIIEEIRELGKISIPVRGDIMTVDLETQWGYSWDKKDLKDWEGHF